MATFVSVNTILLEDVGVSSRASFRPNNKSITYSFLSGDSGRKEILSIRRGGRKSLRERLASWWVGGAVDMAEGGENGKHASKSNSNNYWRTRFPEKLLNNVRQKLLYPVTTYAQFAQRNQFSQRGKIINRPVTKFIE